MWDNLVYRITITFKNSFIDPHQIITILQQSQADAQKIVASMLGTAVSSFWHQYWFWIIILFVASSASLIIQGRIGRLIYRLFKFGLLASIILIFGFVIIFNPYFELIFLAVCITAYRLTGRTLRNYFQNL